MMRRLGLPRKRKRTKVRIGRRAEPLCRKLRTMEHVQTTQRPNPRLWPKSPSRSPPSPELQWMGPRFLRRKKKKSAELERFRLEQREAKAKEMARAKNSSMTKTSRPCETTRKPSPLISSPQSKSQHFSVGEAPEGGQLHEQKVRQEEEPHVS